MKSHPDSQFILIGDNGEYDVAAYQQVRENLEVGGRVAQIFIHHLYEGPPSMSLIECQTPFLTTADLSWEPKTGLITELNWLVLFLRPESQDSTVKNRTLPLFTDQVASTLTLLQFGRGNMVSLRSKLKYLRLPKCASSA
jgi:hypothetical protein